jgi:ActR/RegA family two-component response regulator
MSANKKNILIVEDSEPDKVLISQRVKQKWTDVTIIESSSISQAIELVKSEPIDMVLLDLNLNDSIGPNTVKEMRSLFKDLSIVVLTGLANDTIVNECLKLGANHVAVKSQLLDDDFFNILEENVA